MRKGRGRALTASIALVGVVAGGCSSSGARGQATAAEHAHGTAGRSEHGTVTGRLLLEGGPAPGKETPASGVVYAFTGMGLTGRPVARARAGSQGRFSLDLPPGTYYLAGSSPTFVPDARSATPPCHAAGAAVVAAGATSHVNVACQMR